MTCRAAELLDDLLAELGEVLDLAGLDEAGREPHPLVDMLAATVDEARVSWQRAKLSGRDQHQQQGAYAHVAAREPG